MEKKNKKKEEIKKKGRILVVDDSDYCRFKVVKILEEEDFNVVGHSKSAKEGLQQTFTTEANIFIIDIVMPEVSGLEFAEIIRENVKEGKIIMMSSLDTQNILIKSLSVGAIDILNKPIEREDLIRSIQKIEYEMVKEGVF